MSFPFSPYDFFGYLVAGFVVVCAAESATGSNWVLNQELKWPQAAFWVMVAYITGHVVANLSSYFIEHKFLRGVLDCPEVLLFQDEPAPPPGPAAWGERLTSWRWWLSWLNPAAWWRWLFPHGLKRGLFPIYYKPLPQQTRARVLEKAVKEGFAAPGRALFYHCLATVKKDKTTYERLTSFLNLYGLCRNVCMAALIAAPVLVWGAYRDVTWGGWRLWGELHTDRLLWALAALGCAAGMLYRYLKFFRHYTQEVFVSYSEAEGPGDN
jgi:hypothetical protein